MSWLSRLFYLELVAHAVSKKQAFWRLPSLNQFSLVTGMELTAASAVFACLFLCTHKIHAWKSVKKQVDMTQKETSHVCVCVCVRLCSPSILCCLV